MAADVLEENRPASQPPQGRAARRAAAPVVKAPVGPRKRRSESGRTTFVRADGREVEKAQLYLPVELARRLRIHLAQQDRELSEFVNELIVKALQRAGA